VWQGVDIAIGQNISTWSLPDSQIIPNEMFNAMHLGSKRRDKLTALGPTRQKSAGQGTRNESFDGDHCPCCLISNCKAPIALNQEVWYLGWSDCPRPGQGTRQFFRRGDLFFRAKTSIGLIHSPWNGVGEGDDIRTIQCGLGGLPKESLIVSHGRRVLNFVSDYLVHVVAVKFGHGATISSLKTPIGRGMWGIHRNSSRRLMRCSARSNSSSWIRKYMPYGTERAQAFMIWTCLFRKGILK
jgi:hypothetical protein